MFDVFTNCRKPDFKIKIPANVRAFIHGLRDRTDSSAQQIRNRNTIE